MQALDCIVGSQCFLIVHRRCRVVCFDVALFTFVGSNSYCFKVDGACVLCWQVFVVQQFCVAKYRASWLPCAVLRSCVVLVLPSHLLWAMSMGGPGRFLLPFLAIGRLPVRRAEWRESTVGKRNRPWFG